MVGKCYLTCFVKKTKEFLQSFGLTGSCSQLLVLFIILKKYYEYTFISLLQLHLQQFNFIVQSEMKVKSKPLSSWPEFTQSSQKAENKKNIIQKQVIKMNKQLYLKRIEYLMGERSIHTILSRIGSLLPVVWFSRLKRTRDPHYSDECIIDVVECNLLQHLKLSISQTTFQKCIPCHSQKRGKKNVSR